MTKAYIDSKNGAIIIHNNEEKTREEVDIMYKAVTNAGYKCLILSNDVEIEFLNSEIINLDKE
ncbi:hypothetical protein P3U41_06230 [Mammaliicoccus sciuri]|uniref:hypothetical protein n=1 Tax=Mammaliicoccus sciuri TaxID=1296 RepID=UPI002B25EBD8|nr:hypothetical protein [Mammaliicoccus sciuri]WQL34369.1 hypothetical protein P3U41_06230 [Mammaliicoccus sciuri]WQL61308.1 hypothetical protein P3T96_06230 [Mammaliicoccus sciuri]